MKTAAKSKLGGARPGAGRKPKLQREAREMFYAAVDDRWERILEKLDKLIAKGDPFTLRWIIDQRIGRAGQSVDMTSLGEKVLVSLTLFWPTPAPLFADWNAVPGFEPCGATEVSKVDSDRFSTPSEAWC